MIPLNVRLFGGNELENVPVGALVEASDLTFSVLSRGLRSGKPSVSLICLVGDTAVVAQTSLALLATACDAAIAAHGDPRTGMTVLERGEMLGRAQKWLADLETSLREVTWNGPGGQETLGRT